MSRWSPDAAQRLERAALELFTEQGYTATTVPQITARAGLTTRSFFRHFADKREVLFLREREFPAVVSALMAGAPAALAPIDLVMHGLETVAADPLEGWRDDIRARRDVVRGDDRLRERELLKSAMLADAVTTALTEYGVDQTTANVLAPLAVMLFDTALSDWLDDSTGRSLVEVLRATRGAVFALLGTASG